jgi:hypothetical protein
MTKIFRCPKCDSRFDPPLAEDSECPRCGIWFHKWNAAPVVEGEPAPEEPHPDTIPAAANDPASYFGRVTALLFVAIWGIRLAAMDYRDAEINSSFIAQSLDLVPAVASAETLAAVAHLNQSRRCQR